MKFKPIWFLILSLNLFSSWIICSSSSSSSVGLDCDFENGDHNGLCGWKTLGGSANNSWHRTTTGSIEANTGLEPSKAWLTTSQLDRSLNNQFQFLASTVQLKAKSTYCLTFWYYLQAVEDRPSIEVLRFISSDLPAENLEDEAHRTLFSTVKGNGLEWTRAQLRIVPPALGSFSYGLESTSSPDYYPMFIGKLQKASSSIGIDDIRLFEGECPVVDKNFCDFELNTCGWELNGTEVSTNYIDHTTGAITGHLARIDERNHDKYRASITKSMSTLTNIFDNNDRKQQVCMQFFYFIYTDWLESYRFLDPNATISIKVQNGTEMKDNYTISLMDTFDSGQLAKWTMFRANFEVSQESIIEIESNRKLLATQLYVDDISFRAGQCETDGNCDFETDMCGWQNIVNWQYKNEWSRIKANSSYIQGGHLGQDRTTRTAIGNYVVYPLKMTDDKNSTSFLSPLIINDDNQLDKICFSMWYFVQTRDTLMEAIEVQLKDIRQKRSTSKHVTGTQLLEWKLFSVQLHNLPERFQIQFRVLNPENILSNVGLDDIRLVPGDC